MTKMKKRKQTIPIKGSKITKTFLYMLAIISILGFLAIVGNTWFNFTYLDDNLSSILLIIFGIGLMIEGNVRFWIKMAKDGLTSNELAHLITGIVGILAFTTGLMDWIGIVWHVIPALKGVVASIGIIVIIFETWIID